MVLVPFQGDHLEATRDDAGEVWVVLKRVCANLGIDANAQKQRLQRTEWATACVMHAVANDGKNRAVFCLHIDTIPTWLVTIETARVKASIRPKLVAYQKECAKVLRDHFFGKAAPPSGPRLRDNDEILEKIMYATLENARSANTIATRVTQLEQDMAKKFDEFREGVRRDAEQDAQRRTDEQTGTIGPRKRAILCGKLQEAARIRASILAHGQPGITKEERTRLVQKARGKIEMRLRDVVEHAGQRSAWHLLPLHKEAKALRFVEQDIEDHRDMYVAMRAPPPQMSLFEGEEDEGKKEKH